MKRKSIVVLLVLLLVGILAFTAFACNKPDPEPTPEPPPTPTPPEETVNYLSDAINDLVAGGDNLIRVINDIDDEAYIGADISLALVMGEGDDQFTLDLALSLKASLSTATANRNWALVEIDVNDDNVALFAEATDADSEIVYLGQSLTGENYTWSKFSQIDVDDHAADSGIVEGILTGANHGLIARVFTAIQDIKAMEIQVKAADEEKGTPAVVEKFEDLAEDGLLDTFAGSYLSLVTVVADLLPTTMSEAGGVTTYEATLDLAAVGSVVPDLLGAIKVFAPTFDLSAYESIIDFIGPIVLGLSYDQLTGAPGATIPDNMEFPTLRLTVQTANDMLRGIGIHYDYDVALGGSDPQYVSLDLNISNIELSASARDVDRPSGVENAEEFAAHIALDAAVPALNGAAADAIVDLYVKPGVQVGFDEDGFVAIDFTGLEGYATLRANRDNTPINEAMIAQYNEELGGFVIDLKPVFDLVGTTSINGTYDFFIPFDAQEKFDAWIDSKKPAPPAGGEGGEAATLEVNRTSAANIDAIIDTIFELVNAENPNILNAVMELLPDAIGVLNSLEGIFENTQIFDIVEGDTSASVTISLADLMAELLASDGLIGGLTSEHVKFDLYTGTGNEKGSYSLAQILAGDDVLDHIVTFVNSLIYESEIDKTIRAAYDAEIEAAAAAWKLENSQQEGEDEKAYEERALAAAVKAVGAYDAYAKDETNYNEAVTAYGTYEDFIKRTDSAEGVLPVTRDEVLAWGEKFGIDLDSNANLYEVIGEIVIEASYKAGIKVSLDVAGIEFGITADIGWTDPDTDMTKPAEVSGTVDTVGYSNNTGKDEGRLLFNTLKELANAALFDTSAGDDRGELVIVDVPGLPVVEEEPAA